MGDHFNILLLFLALAAVITVVFLIVYSSSKRAVEVGGMHKANKKRVVFLLTLSALAIILLSVTIPHSPYYLFADATPSKVVYVGAQQFSFVMSNQQLDPKRPGAGTPVKLKAGEIVEFRVISFDVNHGFGIYNDKAELIAQTQAMPGYVNKLRWKFEKPGTYNILCLEYCGAAHSFMRSSFTVK